MAVSRVGHPPTVGLTEPKVPLQERRRLIDMRALAAAYGRSSVRLRKR